MSTLLEVRDLYLEFKTSRGRLKALNGITFDAAYVRFHQRQADVYGVPIKYPGEGFGHNGRHTRLS